jgi:hypothetical protein
MHQRVSLITLGVDDISRARGFYEALGWHGQQVEDTVFFQAAALAIVLWGRPALADDAGVSNAAGPHGLAGIALAHNVRSRQEVDQLLDQHGERAPRSPELRPRPSTGVMPATSPIPMAICGRSPATRASCSPTTALWSSPTSARARRG